MMFITKLPRFLSCPTNMPRASITDDEGKQVVDADADTFSIVSTVRNGTAYADPDPSTTDKLMSQRGWNDTDEDDFPLGSTQIDTILMRKFD